ncbi:MAG TPA: hypothetical protein VH330_09515 [Candidatus Udaeobacter sp.]|jgi:2'-5' RNA ligase
MKRIAIAYWLLPDEPARRFFQGVINELALRYDAPVFEPHVTVHVGPNSTNAVGAILSKAARGCERIVLRPLEVGGSSEFIKTLFVHFAMDNQLKQLTQNIRAAARDCSDYHLDPHLSLLYRKTSNQDRCLLKRSIEIPFSQVTFDSLRAVRCISPTQSRADVEAWRVVAEKDLGE